MDLTKYKDKQYFSTNNQTGFLSKSNHKRIKSPGAYTNSIRNFDWVPAFSLKNGAKIPEFNKFETVTTSVDRLQAVPAHRPHKSKFD